MTVGEIVRVRGYVTQDKYLIGRNLAEIERLLGYHAGRLALGASFMKLNSLPGPNDFVLAAYSITPEHRYAPPPNLDSEKLKAIAMSRWSLGGGDRLVKVRPVIDHDDDMDANKQYPTGAGVPQWKLTEFFEGTIVAEVQTLSGIYRPTF